MLLHISDDGKNKTSTDKTVQSEAIRLFKVIIKMESAGVLTKALAGSFQDRITAQLGLFNDDLLALETYARIESELMTYQSQS